MSTYTSLHGILDNDNWNLEDIKNFLENDSSSVNKENSSGDTPLIRVLENEKCAVDVVELLVNYGSDVNYSRYNGWMTPMLIALQHRRNVDFINLLLVKGAGIDDIRRPTCGSLLCYAIMYKASIDVILLLLNAGCLSFPCRMHVSALHCVCTINSMSRKIEEGVLQLLIERGVDVNAVDEYGRSVLCYALRNGIQAKRIKVLLEAGGLLNCKIHTNPFLCATNFKDVFQEFTGTELKADVVHLLLEQGACLNIDVLRSALDMYKIETEALGLLLDCLQGVDINAVKDECSNTLLHDAANNFNCSKSVVKLLVKRGVRVDSVNNLGETALHRAASVKVCNVSRSWTSLSSVVKTLLKRGSRVNLENAHGETPLHLAMELLEDPNILKILLAGCARFGVAGHSLLKRAFDKCDAAEGNWETKRRLDCCKLLLKFYFVVENPHLDFLYLIQGHHEYEELSRFGVDCVGELQKLDSKIVGQSRTLREFLSECSPFQVDAANFVVEVESLLFNRLLRIIAETVFPLFFDIIVAKVGRSSMKIKLKKLQVYTYLSDDPRMGEKVVLNYDTVYKIAHLLTDEDLLRFISAFNKTNLMP